MELFITQSVPKTNSPNSSNSYTISQDFHETEEETKFSKIHVPSFLPADPYLREEDIFLQKKKNVK